MKDFFVKKSNLFLFVISCLILLTLVFNYVSYGIDRGVVRGYQAIFGVSGIEGFGTVQFNIGLVLVMFLPFILTLISLIYEEKYRQDLYFRIIFYLGIFVAFLLAFLILQKFNYYMKGYLDMGGITRNLLYATSSYEVLVFAKIASYLAVLGAMTMLVKIVIDYGQTHTK